ncbi:hypothetical protein CLU79DRAFT_751775 [Phycomyces nitens]|nr:hypothetical protein CLU79DRAFT_751775 [Phycomyces nitens]
MDSSSAKTTPILNPSPKIPASPNIGQPMSASYEHRWLSNDDRKPQSVSSLRKSHLSEDSGTTTSTATKGQKPNEKEKATKEQQKQHGRRESKTQIDTNPSRKSQKDMTKAERRALQEQQRAEKQSRLVSGGSKSAGKQPEDSHRKSVGNSGGSTANNASTTNSNVVPLAGGSAVPSVPLAGKADEKQVKKPHAAKHSQNQVPWLMHLDVPKKPDMSSKELHPAVITLGLYFSEFKIVGSNARCVAMLKTFAKVIEDHRPPADASFSRNIQKHLDPNIAYLLANRPMSLSMRECIRWLKKEMSDIVEHDPPLSDEESRARLIQHIEDFIRDRITLADQLIVQYGLQKINDGDVILTYGKSSVVEALLLETKKKGIEFKVIVVDSRPLFEGKHLLKRLSTAGIDCTYYLLSSIYVALKSVTKVVMGAHALLNNGAVYSRIGSAMVAMAASDLQIPVMICCETYKFVNRTQVDSLVMNELGNPDALVNTKSISNANHQGHPSSEQSALVNWRDQHNLRLLNMLYDVTPSKYITLVVTEVGLIPCTSAPVIWREYK